jgi:hypothetical protein
MDDKRPPLKTAVHSLRSAGEVVAATAQSADELLVRLPTLAPERRVLGVGVPGTRGVERLRPLSHLWSYVRAARHASDALRQRAGTPRRGEPRTSREGHARVLVASEPTNERVASELSMEALAEFVSARCSTLAEPHRTPDGPRSAPSRCRSRRAAQSTFRFRLARPTGRRSTRRPAPSRFPFKKTFVIRAPGRAVLDQGARS